MRFFDVHTHILPTVDDGAQNKEQSQQMISMLKEQGITDIILTPHFYHYEMSKNNFISKRDAAFEQVKDFFLEKNITPHLGAEVYLVDTIFGYTDISDLCIDRGSYILVELPLDENSRQKIITMLYKLCANYCVKPIIAHIEKYPAFFNYDFLYEVNKLGCLVQFDIDSLRKFFLRNKIKKYIGQGMIQLAGSDCHNLNERKPDISVLKKYLSENMCQYLFNNSHITF